MYHDGGNLLTLLDLDGFTAHQPYAAAGEYVATSSIAQYNTHTTPQVGHLRCAPR
jgi:hypothetical protein